MTVKHAFTSPKADGGDATLVRPSNWNADHTGFPALGSYQADMDASVLVQDFDSRVVASGSWGQAQRGGSWITGYGLTGVTGSEGTMTGNGGGLATQAVLNVNPECQLDFKSGVVSTASDHLQIWLRSFRASGQAYGLRFDLIFTSANLVQILMAWDANDGTGPHTALATTTIGRETWVANTYFTIRIGLVGNHARMKVWRSSSTEPFDWDVIQLMPPQAPPISDQGTEITLLWSPNASDPANTGTFKNVLVREAKPRTAGTFDITGLSSLTTSQPVLISQAVGPYDLKGTSADEAEGGMVDATGYVVSASTIRVYWESVTPVSGPIKFVYAVGG